jgi:hypothetical protein
MTRRTPLNFFASGAVSPVRYFCFRLQPEFLVPAHGPSVLLPKFVGPRAYLLLKPPCSNAPFQLLPQFLNKPPKALRCRLVRDTASEPLCPFNLALQFAGIVVLIHSALSNKAL